MNKSLDFILQEDERDDNDLDLFISMAETIYGFRNGEMLALTGGIIWSANGIVEHLDCPFMSLLFQSPLIDLIDQ